MQSRLRARIYFVFIYVSCCLYLCSSFQAVKSTKCSLTRISNLVSPKDFNLELVRKASLIPAVLYSQLLFSKRANADSNIFTDKTIGYQIDIPPGWVGLPRSTPTTTLSKYQQEQVLFTANNFAEGVSLSITRTASRRLLKDFNIEWWFASLEKIQDLGTPELLSELLILQRQGNFEKKDTPSELLTAKFDDSEQACLFEFNTPLAEEVNRKTIAKAYYRGDSLLVVWISALTSVYEGDYSEQLYNLRNTFLLIK